MIKVKDITFSYKDKKILDNISFEIEDASMVGVLGHNGTGKSTLFKNILLLEKPTKGYVDIDGDIFKNLNTTQRAKIVAYVPQFMELMFSITVFDFILIGAKLNTPKEKIADAKYKTSQIIEKFKLTELAFKDMRKMSGGERQRAYIARAFAQNPKVILLDEPTSNLDFRYKNTILSLLKDMVKNTGQIVFMAIHDLDIASKYCDTFIVLKDGHILASGDADAVYQKDILETAYDTNIDILDYKDQKIVVFV